MAFVESAAQTGANWEIVYAWTDLKSISGIHWEKKSSLAFLKMNEEINFVTTFCEE